MNAARLLLAGASWRERLLACLGALAGIGFTALATASLPLHLLPFLVAPMGASAVLVFAVPRIHNASNIHITNTKSTRTHNRNTGNAKHCNEM